MKLRITQTGMQSYSGLLGDTWFVDGLSATEMTEQQCAYVRSFFAVEEVADEQPTSDQSEGKNVELGGKMSVVAGEQETAADAQSKGGQ